MSIKLKLRRFHCLLVIALAILALLTQSEKALAYGNYGHYTIANVAEARLTPKSRAEVNRLLIGASMAEVSQWANDLEIDNLGDMPNRRSLEQLLAQKDVSDFRKSRFASDSASWHETYMPLFHTNYMEWRTNKLNVPDASLDLVQIIDLCVASLRDEEAATSKIPRNVALMLLIHFVGDIHQPLHTAQAYLNFKDPKKIEINDGSNAVGLLADRGGSIIQLRGSKSFHGFWDDTIVENASTSHLLSKETSLNSSVSYAAWLTSHMNSVVQEEASQPFLGATERWFDESHKVAADSVYTKQVRVSTISLKDKWLFSYPYKYKISELPIAYQVASISVVDKQLLRAGVRLAGLLNSIFDQPTTDTTLSELPAKPPIRLLDGNWLTPYNDSQTGFSNLLLTDDVAPQFRTIQAFPPEGIERNRLGLTPDDDYFGRGSQFCEWRPINKLQNKILIIMSDWKPSASPAYDANSRIRKLEIVSEWRDVTHNVQNMKCKVAVRITTPSALQDNCWELKTITIQKNSSALTWKYANDPDLIAASKLEVQRLINKIQNSPRTP